MNIAARPRAAAAKLDSHDERHPAARPRAAQSPLAKSLTLAAMSLGYVVVQLDVTIVNVAINSIGSSFGGTLADLQWIVNAYTITFAAFILTAGALGDRIGAKRVFVLGFVIFVLASLACALAPTLWALISPACVRGSERRSWCRTRSRCSTTSTRTKRSAIAPSAYGPRAQAFR
jgi:DHA2 family methylenomycin A resistance protein-like MFS transporter